MNNTRYSFFKNMTVEKRLATYFSRFFLLVAIIFIALHVEAQLGAKLPQNNSLAGIWDTDQFGIDMPLILNTDGTGEFGGESLTYMVDGTTLRITQGGQEIAYHFSVSNNKLTISGVISPQT